MAEKLSRRVFLHTAATLAGGVLLAACQPKVVEKIVKETVEVEKIVKETVEVEKIVKETVIVEKEVAPPIEEVTEVTVQTAWFAQEEPGRDFWQRAIKLFSEKEENADLKVTLINVATSPEDMLTSIAGGTAPDIYHTYGGTTGSFDVEDLAPRGVAIELDDFMPTARYFKKEEYYPEQWEQKTWNGKVWGLPVTEGGPGCCAMSWHKRIFEAAGLDPDKGPATWEQMIDYALKLSTYDDDGNVDVEGFDPLDACGCCWPNWMWWCDSPGISEDKRTILFNQNHWGDFLELIAAIYQGIGVEKMAAHKLAWSYWTGHKSGFPNGKRAMLLNGYWQPGEFVSVLADQSWEIGYDWPPNFVEGKKAMGFGGTHTLWMTSNTEQPAQAFRFMDFMMSVEVNILNFELRGGFVLSEPLLKVLDVGRYKGLDWFMKMRAEADVVYSPLATSSPIGAEVNKLWNRAVQEAIYDEKTPKQALDDITTELQESLDRAWEAME